MVLHHSDEARHRFVVLRVKDPERILQTVGARALIEFNLDVEGVVPNVDHLVHDAVGSEVRRLTDALGCFEGQDERRRVGVVSETHSELHINFVLATRRQRIHRDTHFVGSCN